MLEHFIDHYGYLAILIGTFIEGETVLILGGIAARFSTLEIEWVIFFAFIGTLTGDQLFFFLGRYHGQAYLSRHPSWLTRANKASEILHRNRILIILGFRFLYGLRMVTPFVIGMSKVPALEFIILNIIGAALWAVSIGLLGFAFGHGLELILGDIKRYELEIMAGVLVLGSLLWLVFYLTQKKKA